MDRFHQVLQVSRLTDGSSSQSTFYLARWTPIQVVIATQKSLSTQTSQPDRWIPRQADSPLQCNTSILAGTVVYLLNIELGGPPTSYLATKADRHSEKHPKLGISFTVQDIS